MEHNHQYKEINGKRIFICEHHHHVLKFWSEFKHLNPYLLTFDHHTDLLRAFQGFLLPNPITRRFRDQDHWDAEQGELLLSIAENDFDTILKLGHDEHIDAAIKAGFIKKALVYSEGSYYGRPKDIYTIIGDEDYNGQLIINNDNYEDIVDVIDTPVLKVNFRKFDRCIPSEEWTDNFILDIDLDFFKTRRAFEDKDLTFFKHLIDKSIAISIATEPLFIKSWQAQYDSSLSVEYLLEKIMELIEG